MNRHQQTKAEIYPLTGIRAAAALWVVTFHMQGQIEEAYPSLRFLISPIVSHGYLGVDLFFILSGFIIHYNYSERLSTFSLSAYREFLWMRLARLWPVHLVLLGIFALLIWVRSMRGIAPSNPELYTTLDFVKNIFLVHSWAIPLEISWNVPAWSISCEWLAYIFFPLLIVSRSNSPASYRGIAIAVSALIITAAACQVLHAEGNARHGVIRIAGEFIAGCGLCHVFRSGSARNLPWRQIVPGLILTVFLGSHLILPALGMVSYWCVPLLGAMILGLAHQQCIVSRLCSTKLMLFGGYISYSIYMVHELCLIGLRGSHFLVGKAFGPVANLTGIIAVAVLMYYFVEEPCRQKMRRAFPRHKRQNFNVS
jgi:peptidoglycan/LPS O-acetylase OafA/YrhL